jgi:hypothetical protein
MSRVTYFGQSILAEFSFLKISFEAVDGNTGNSAVKPPRFYCDTDARIAIASL